MFVENVLDLWIKDEQAKISLIIGDHVDLIKAQGLKLHHDSGICALLEVHVELVQRFRQGLAYIFGFP